MRFRCRSQADSTGCLHGVNLGQNAAEYHADEIHHAGGDRFFHWQKVCESQGEAWLAMVRRFHGIVCNNC